MAETKLEKSFASEEQEQQQQRQEVVQTPRVEHAVALEHEIECPRCRDAMTLCSDFDSLYYFCEGCDFCLYTIKK